MRRIAATLLLRCRCVAVGDCGILWDAGRAAMGQLWGKPPLRDGFRRIKRVVALMPAYLSRAQASCAGGAGGPHPRRGVSPCSPGRPGSCLRTSTTCYHTLETLKEQNPDTDYYFIIGADSLYDFSSWREPARICKACTIVVAVRDHVPVEKLNEQMTYLSERYNGRFISLNTLNIDISSQLLRKWHQEGKSLRYYVPDAVADYIDKNHIYHITEGVGHNNV